MTYVKIVFTENPPNEAACAGLSQVMQAIDRDIPAVTPLGVSGRWHEPLIALRPVLDLLHWCGYPCKGHLFEADITQPPEWNESTCSIEFRNEAVLYKEFAMRALVEQGFAQFVPTNAGAPRAAATSAPASFTKSDEGVWHRIPADEDPGEQAFNALMERVSKEREDNRKRTAEMHLMLGIGPKADTVAAVRDVTLKCDRLDARLRGATAELKAAERATAEAASSYQVAEKALKEVSAKLAAANQRIKELEHDAGTTEIRVNDAGCIVATTNGVSVVESAEMSLEVAKVVMARRASNAPPEAMPDRLPSIFSAMVEYAAARNAHLAFIKAHAAEFGQNTYEAQAQELQQVHTDKHAILMRLLSGNV